MGRIANVKALLTALTITMLCMFVAHWISPAIASERVGMVKLEGRVFYLERVRVPADARVLVRLEDVSLADAPAKVLASAELPALGGPPFAFVLEYDPTLIDPRHRYAMRARIEVDGRLWFTNTRHIPAFANGGEPVQVLVEQVGGE